MKKFINKLTSSGKLDSEELKGDTDEYDEQPRQDTHVRKSEALDNGDHSRGDLEPEDFKFKKSFSLRTLSPLMKSTSAITESNDDFSKKKSSSMKIMPSLKQDKPDKEKLHDSDDKTLKKSFSFANVFKTDSPKSPELFKSPSGLKNSLSSQYEQHYDFDDSDGSSSSDDDSQKVPKKKGGRRRTQTTNADFAEPHPPVTKLASSAPAYHTPPTSTYHAPPSSIYQQPHLAPPSATYQPYHAAPAPTLHARGAASPPPIVPVLGNSPSPPRTQYAESPAQRTQASPPRAQVSLPRVPEPEMDDFDLQFGRMRSDSNVSDDGMLINGNPNLSFFSSFSNKSRKLK